MTSKFPSDATVVYILCCNDVRRFILRTKESSVLFENTKTENFRFFLIALHIKDLYDQIPHILPFSEILYFLQIFQISK